MTISRLPQLVSIDASKLTDRQLAMSEKIFDDLDGRRFLPANEAYRDDTRKDLDRAVLIDLLGFEDQLLDNLAILRDQWCAEPGVHGGKATRIGIG